MNEREIERVQSEEVTLAHNTEFAVVRKHHNHQVDPQEEIRRSNYLRSVEDAVEQNDNSFDGIINNLPEEATEDKPKEPKTKESVVDEIKKQQEECRCQTASKPAPRVLYTDGEERVI